MLITFARVVLNYFNFFRSPKVAIGRGSKGLMGVWCFGFGVNFMWLFGGSGYQQQQKNFHILCIYLKCCCCWCCCCYFRQLVFNFIFAVCLQSSLLGVFVLCYCCSFHGHYFLRVSPSTSPPLLFVNCCHVVVRWVATALWVSPPIFYFLKEFFRIPRILYSVSGHF